ncbi:MAG: helix-turn-helix transcriptional regulator [Dehalococcoidia bacterium]|nr:helix-turn-helix transcriptional regulator [Dehalococcoidia bacterium]RLC65052.1 MAG: PadR family transcriptional regulator [Chloroflexota bacterium]
MTQSYVCQLLRGVVEPLLLFIIGELPVHGYEIARELERRSEGYFDLTASTLYSALRRLEKRGLVSSSWQYIAKQKRRCYELTEKGRKILAEELTQWEKFLGATDRVIDSQ